MTSNIEEIEDIFINEFNKRNISLNETFILGVSGGPDSMWLLNLMKNKNIIVACVNYNKRYDSWVDQKVVEDFCKKNNIKYELLVLEKENKEQNKKGNFQSLAREERYKFYKEIYFKYNAKYLVLAHHKDDLIETYLFQKESKRHPKNYGIAATNYLFGMNIFRPMLNIWYKDEIFKFCIDYNIPYAIDSTNTLPLYTRNKIRIKLFMYKKEQKEDLIEELRLKNKELDNKNNIIENKYLNFKNSNFNYKKLDLNHPYINEILFLYLHKNITDLKVSKNKIEAIKGFIMSQKNYKIFKLNNETGLLKDKHLLKIVKINKT